MRQLPCDIVKDLLPLYVDDVCSGQSKDAVKEHLDYCGSCSQEYEAMKEKLPDILSEETAFEKDIKWLKQKWRIRSARPVFILGILLLCACIFFSVFPDILRPLFLVSPQHVQVTELYELKDGTIYLTLQSDKKIVRASQGMTEISPQDRFEKIYTNGQRNAALYSFTFDSLLSPNITKHSECSFVFSLSEKEYTLTESGEKTYITLESAAIYYVGKFNKKKILWKKGQELEPAPAPIEAKVALERKRQAAFYSSKNYGDSSEIDLVIFSPSN